MVTHLNIRNILAIIGVLIIGCLIPQCAKAQQAKYWIEHQLDNCKGKEKSGTHTVLAYSDAQYTWCSWQFQSLKEARQVALRKCFLGIPTMIRRSAPCRIVYSDKIILDRDTFSRMKRDMQIPVNLEIFDHISGKKQNAQGYIVIGKYTDAIRRPVTIALRNGSQLCSGFYEFAYGANQLKFAVNCFNKYEFTQNRVRRTGFVQVEGTYHPIFQIKLRHRDSYIKVDYQ